ncbi:Las17-binding protein actin regulator [Shimia gijangensis]|uniref:Las17-binding protein actin regulator n=1 Tax=Shimia gijangensis TaxID=1470563 RepID=A0A1M6SIH3_9RHOB|nr:lipid-binding SYLF domain-containing protein [Shimia gijangensis]SHK44564.1 Las17-binding protein actin regulator [Shimia gijangensis]
MTKSTFRKLSLIATFAALGSTAIGQTATGENTIEGWTILRSVETSTCVMEKVNEDGYLFRMGKEEPGDVFGYVAVYTQDENLDIYGNVSNEVVLDLDGERFDAKATGHLRDDGWRGAYVRSRDPAFIEALARKYVLTVDPEGKTPFAISLDGTFKAMAATRDCEAASLASMAVADDGKRGELIIESQAAWASLLSQNDRARELSESASAALVFPKVTKAGLGVGGERGNGVLFVGEAVSGYYRTTSLAVGALAGVQTYGYALMFMTPQALERFQSKRGFELGVDGSVAVMNSGATAEIDTTNLKADMVAFVFNEQGLMASAAVEGSRIKPIE